MNYTGAINKIKKFLESNEGDVVMIKRAGDVIPQVTKVDLKDSVKRKPKTKFARRSLLQRR